MQRPKSKPGQSRKKTNTQPKTGRVVDLRAWRMQRQLQELRGRKPWTVFILYMLTAILAGLAGLTAVVSCVPVQWESHGIILTWFLSTIGASFGLWLYVLNHRAASRLLAVFVVCMALSIVSAMVKMIAVTH